MKRLTLLFVVTTLAAGCHSAKVAHPLTEDLAGNDPDKQLEFWHTLADRKVTSNDEAFHGVMLFTDGQDGSDDYAHRVQIMKDRGMLPKGFSQPADVAVERSVLAMALVKALDIKGGVVMRVFGPSPRYSLREAEYLGLFPNSGEHQTFSGAEFLGIIGRAEDYQRLNPSKLPPPPASTTQPSSERFNKA